MSLLHAARDVSPLPLPQRLTCWFESGVTQSRGEARRAIAEGGIYLNDHRDRPGPGITHDDL